MKIVTCNTSELLEELATFTDKRHAEHPYDCYEDGSSIRENPQNYVEEEVVFDDNNRIIGVFASPSPLFDGSDVMIRNLYWYKFKRDMDCIRLLDEKYPGCVIRSEWLPDNFDSEKFKICTRQSTFSENEYALYHGCYMTSGDENVIVKAIESSVPTSVNMDEVEIRVLSYDEIEKQYESMAQWGGFYEGRWKMPNNFYRPTGFHYFDFHHVTQELQKRLRYECAFYQNRMVGLICMSNDVDSGVQWVSYIDVFHTLRNNGIASKLIKEFPKACFENVPVIVTAESDMGKMCHVGDKFIKALTDANMQVSVRCY